MNPVWYIASELASKRSKWKDLSICTTNWLFTCPPQDFHQPRVYTKAFGDKIKSLFPGVVTGGIGRPDVSSDENSPEYIFQDLEWSTWEEAKLLPCIRYLRGNRHLEIPPTWKQAFPTVEEILGGRNRPWDAWKQYFKLEWTTQIAPKRLWNYLNCLKTFVKGKVYAYMLIRRGTLPHETL